MHADYLFGGTQIGPDLQVSVTGMHCYFMLLIDPCTWLSTDSVTCSTDT